jgi:hypothetical protein
LQGTQERWAAQNPAPDPLDIPADDIQRAQLGQAWLGEPTQRQIQPAQPQAHRAARLASITCQIFSAMFTPSKRSSS